MDTLHDRDILILGLGASGLAMARWCAREGARVRVWDSREPAPNAQALADSVPSARRLHGPLDAQAVEGVQLLLRSPGLSPTDPRLQPVLAEARRRGVPVHSELDLFVQALAALRVSRGYAPRVVAITGTNGKTTTTAMTALLIQRTGKRVAAAGNIGPTMLQTLADALDLEPAANGTAVPDAVDPDVAQADAQIHDAQVHDAARTDEPHAEHLHEMPADEADGGDVLTLAAERPMPARVRAPRFDVLPDVWVLELSSFQLFGVHGFEPDVATVLNVTQDHLDWHGTLTEYAASKARVFGSRAVMVVNRDDPLVEAMVPAPQTVKRAPGRKGGVHARRVVRFGLGVPSAPGDFGVVDEHGMAWLVRARELDETMSRSRGGKGGGIAALEELSIQRLMPADALRVRGRHNTANALAALALATAIDTPMAPMLHGLREYEGEPHRVQHVATLDGVEVYDDSKGTNVGATVAALNGLGADRAPGKLALILGGDAKGQDFTPLVDPVRRHARAVALIGRDAQALELALDAAGVPMRRFEQLQSATRWCFERAQPGDAVLLSPACSSLDMFRDYKHRAEVFADEVRAVMADRGGVA